MRILVTRPEPDAHRFAAQLREYGIDAVVAPMMSVELGTAPLPPLGDVQAIVFTSANGVRAYAALHGRGDLPVYAVGEATAAAARLSGYADAVSAGSDAEGLAALLAGRIDPAKGALFHPTGADQAGDLAGALRARGFELKQAVVYRAVAVAALPPAARAALEAGELAGVALFSARSAGIFVDRALAAGLGAKLGELDAFCLSRAVAAALQGKAAWRAVRVAARPNAEALIALIRAERTEDRRPMTDEPAAPQSDRPGDRGSDRISDHANDAERVIAAFGGIRPMAKALGIAVTTVQGWKERGAIPLKRMPEIRDNAARAGIDLEAALAEPHSLGVGTAPPEFMTEAPKPPPHARPDERIEAVAAEKISPGPEPGLRAAETAPPPPPTFDAPPPAAGGNGRWRWATFGAGFGATFVAGIIVAAILGIGGRSGGAPERQAALDRLQSRIDNVTRQLEDQQKRQQADAAALQTRLNRIESAERAIGEQRERLAGLAGNAAALASRIEKLDTDMKALATRTPAGAEDLKGLKEQIDALARRVDALPKNAPDAGALAGLAREMRQASEKIAALERRLGELAQARPANEAEQKAALERQAAEAKAALERFAAEARAAGQKLAAEAEQMKKDLAALTGRVGALAEDVRRAGSASNEVGTLVLALGQLRRAVQEGAPYRAALDAAKALTRDRKEFEPALAMLGARADQGVPTVAQLRQRFDRLSVTMLRAAAAPKPDADFWDRIWARLQTLVTVRRVGEVGGETVAAHLSRAEAALARGDLAEAVKQVSALNGAAREAAAEWLADARARQVSDGALAELDRAALSLLRQPETRSPR